jgi:hypothetical protein
MRLEDLDHKLKQSYAGDTGRIGLNYGVGTRLQCCNNGSFKIIRGSELGGGDGRFLRTFPIVVSRN